VDPELAAWLVSAAAEPALAAAAAEADPDSVAAAQRLRRDWEPAQAAAALTQARLRRRAVTKFGSVAQQLFFTTEGLEQATRAEVARWRARRFREAGVDRVVDVGCGLGADALAFAEAGLEVVALEADATTAVLAAANLAGRGRVITGDATCGDGLNALQAQLSAGAAVFIDPARRTAAGRSWRVLDFSPSWDFATGLLAGNFGCIKGAPGLPSALIPPGVGATWVSHRGDLVEASIWSSGPRQAVLLPSGAVLDADSSVPVSVGEVERYLYEPDPAVLRSGASSRLAALMNAHRLSPEVAYLSSTESLPTPFATGFEVLAVMPYSERELRAWVRRERIGVLEIKVRGLDVDPAVLRRRLKLSGPVSATVVLTPTGSGARALVVRRLPH
jgi:THUMP domain-containing protein